MRDKHKIKMRDEYETEKRFNLATAITGTCLLSIQFLGIIISFILIILNATLDLGIDMLSIIAIGGIPTLFNICVCVLSVIVMGISAMFDHARNF